MLTEALTIRAAAQYRRLRGLGITPRGTPDLMVASWRIAHAVPLLHRDRDFDLIAGPLGLPIQPVWTPSPAPAPGPDLPHDPRPLHPRPIDHRLRPRRR
jgi:hypothetical protein